MPRHFANLDAHTVKSRSLMLVADEIEGLLRGNGIGLFGGVSRSGKDYAVDYGLERAGVRRQNCIILDFARTPSEKAVVDAMHLALTKELPTGRGLDVAQDRVAVIQSELHRPVRILEAQHWARVGLAAIRHVYDLSGESFPLIVTGSEDMAKRMRRYACLPGRALTDMQMEPMTPKEIVAEIPTFHPIYHEATPKTIAMVNATRCQGLMGSWAAFTQKALASSDPPPTTLTESLARKLLRGFNRPQ